jgi:hypothetical protein
LHGILQGLKKSGDPPACFLIGAAIVLKLGKIVGGLAIGADPCRRKEG